MSLIRYSFISVLFGVSGFQQSVVASEVTSSLATTPAKYHIVPVERVFDAVVEAVQRATVSAQTAGRITEIGFDDGDFVPKGSVIIRFRDKEQRSRAQAAEARLAETRARVFEAEKEFKRIEGVYQRKLVSKAALDKASANLSAARARLRAAKAQLKEATEQLEHTVVKAPYSGIVVKRHVEVGESARIGQPLVTGLSLERLRATANIPQTIVNSVLARKQARIIVTNRAEHSVAAERIVLVPCAQQACTSYKMRVYMPAGQEGLYPGMFVKAGFVTGEQRKLLVPATAVVQRSEVTAVYVLSQDKKVSLRQVRVGRQQLDGLIEVLAGLQEGEHVINAPLRAGIYLKQQTGSDK